MSVPALRLRKDIWAHFPVNVDSMGRGGNGVDRHCIEWHNQKVRQIAQAEGKTPDQVKRELLPRLIGALSASRAWLVEAPEPGSKCVAVIAMRFLPANTRKANHANNKSTTTRKNGMNWRKSPNKPNKTHKASSPKRNETRKAPKNLSDLTGDALKKKAVAILNKMSEATFARLAAEFASLQPKTESDRDTLVQVLADIAMDQQAYHPLLIRLLQMLEAKDKLMVDAVVAKVVQRCMEEPVFAKMEVAAEEASPNKNIEEKVLLQKRFFRATTLFTGFLYRDGLLGWPVFSKVLQQFASVVFETDPAELDYRIYDATAQGLLYLLIRGGARMKAEEPAAFAKARSEIQRLAKEAKRGLVRTDATEFLEAADNHFLIKPNMTWTVGAPTTDIRKKTPQQPQPPKAAKADGLGSDVSELWRRFPLDVKQVGDAYHVRFHNKKLQERYQKESAKYKSFSDFQQAIEAHIMRLVDTSTHWKRGPTVSGTLLTIERR